LRGPFSSSFIIFWLPSTILSITLAHDHSGGKKVLSLTNIPSTVRQSTVTIPVLGQTFGSVKNSTFPFLTNFQPLS